MYSPVPPYDPICRSGEARPGTHFVAQMFTTVDQRRTLVSSEALSEKKR